MGKRTVAYEEIEEYFEHDMVRGPLTVNLPFMAFDADASGWALIYLGVFISVQFDYWEVRPNELLHHHGILSDLERFSAPNLRIDMGTGSPPSG